MSLIIFILILSLIIFVHEFGHFIMAKIFGVYVHEFSLGMGPKLFSFKGKNGETEYSLRALPIGGFVSLEGEEYIEENSDIPVDRRLYAKPIWQRFLIMVFGVVNNLILAFLLFLTIFLVHAPLDQTPILDKPFINNGLQEGDLVVEVNNQKVKTIDDINLALAIANNDSKILVPIDIKVKRNDKVEEQHLVPTEVNGELKYGISFQNKVLPRTKSVGAAFKSVTSNIKQIFVVLKNLLTGNLSVKTLSGPVGIYQAVDTVKDSAGLIGTLFLAAVISINVGVINLLPIPVMDGGKIFFLAIEKLIGKPVDKDLEYKLSLVSFVLLMALALYITGLDIIKLIKK